MDGAPTAHSLKAVCRCRPFKIRTAALIRSLNRGMCFHIPIGLGQPACARPINRVRLLSLLIPAYQGLKSATEQQPQSHADDANARQLASLASKMAVVCHHHQPRSLAKVPSCYVAIPSGPTGWKTQSKGFRMELSVLSSLESRTPEMICEVNLGRHSRDGTQRWLRPLQNDALAPRLTDP